MKFTKLMVCRQARANWSQWDRFQLPPDENKFWGNELPANGLLIKVLWRVTNWTENIIRSGGGLIMIYISLEYDGFQNCKLTKKFFGSATFKWLIILNVNTFLYSPKMFSLTLIQPAKYYRWYMKYRFRFFFSLPALSHCRTKTNDDVID